MEDLTKALKERKRESFRHCEDCVREEKKEEAKGPQVEEQLEFVMICLKCLHVGCTKKKLGHAEEHFKKNPDHPVARGIVGRLYCYECEQDIEVEEETKAKIAEIQRLFDLAICVPTTNIIPAQIAAKLEGEEEKGSMIPLLKQKSSIAIAIELKNESYSSRLLAMSKQIATIKGLQNLGYFNAMLQCLVATLPFAYFYLNPDSEFLKVFRDIKETIDNYASDKRGARMQQFIKEYYSKTPGSLDPSIVFEIICSQKKYFGNFSEQDSLDALLTLLNALIDSQKEVYKAKPEVVDKKAAISNFYVPIGSIFTFNLCNKLTCKECKTASWTFDPALNINAALIKKEPEELKKEESVDSKRYRVEIINGKEYYVPNKMEAIHMEDETFIKEEKELDVDYLLRRFFEEDHLDNPENLFECPSCISKKPKGCKAIKEFYIRDPPSVLIIQLKRFKSSGFSYSKNSTFINNLKEICLDKYVILNDNTIARLSAEYEMDIRSVLESNTVADPELKLFPYRLYAIASHSGLLYGGQYISYVKQGEDWYVVNDVYCNKCTKAQALASEGYLLFYQRLW